MKTLSLATRFTAAPLVLVDLETDRVMVYSDELHEKLIFEQGNWRVGEFSHVDLKTNFKKVASAEAWRYLKLAMSEVGFL